MERELTVDARIDKLDDVTAFVDDCLEAACCPMKVQMQIDVAVEEIFVNIAHYAYAPGNGEALISVEITDEPSTAVISFKDSGVEFDPLARKDPDTTLSADDRDIGGLGIFMVKKSMDEVTYQRVDDKNVLTIRKSWQAL